MEPPLYRRLLPQNPGDAAEVDALAYVRELTLERDEDDRPYVVANFVASADGHATVDQQSRKLSGPADRAMFYALRERVDAVLIGTRTLAAERVKRMLPAPERRERRAQAGLPAEPLAVTISRSGSIPRDIPLFTDASDRVLTFEHEDTELSHVLQVLRREHSVRTLLCEGGPTLFGALLAAELVDELFLTLAPTLTGGTSGPAVISGSPLKAPAHTTPAAALEHHGTLFLRYALG